MSNIRYPTRTVRPMLLRCTVPQQKNKGTCFPDTWGLLDDYLGITGWLFGDYWLIIWDTFLHTGIRVFKRIWMLGYTPVGLSNAQVYSPWQEQYTHHQLDNMASWNMHLAIFAGHYGVTGSKLAGHCGVTLANFRPQICVGEPIKIRITTVHCPWWAVIFFLPEYWLAPPWYCLFLVKTRIFHGQKSHKHVIQLFG